MRKPIQHLLMTAVEDAYDRNSWSGITYSLREALERNVEKLSVFQPSRPSRNLKDILLRQFYGGGINPRYPLWMTEATLRNSGREVSKEIDRVRPDAVLSISSQCLAYLNKPGVPQYMFSDSPWLTWMETYSDFERMHVRGPQFSALETKTAQRIDGLFFGSRWAVEEGVEKYRLNGKQAEKLHVVPLGANWVPEISRPELLQRIANRRNDSVQLLFVGADWERKGGPLAIDVALCLRNAGHSVMLHIVGCRPSLPSSLTDGEGAMVTIHGRLDKNVPEQRIAMQNLFIDSHFLIVPTRAECYGIVFAEAHAFGLPPVSRAINSLPSIILDRKTGILLPEDSPAMLYANRIQELSINPAEYRSMSERALEHYDKVLNWDSAVQKMLTIMQEEKI